MFSPSGLKRTFPEGTWTSYFSFPVWVSQSLSLLPKAEFKELPIFDTKERAELKQIMLEALREYHTGYNASPYTLDELQE